MLGEARCRRVQRKSLSRARFAHWFFCGLILGPQGIAAAEPLPYRFAPIGDGTALGLKVENPTIYPIRTRLGGPDAQMVVEVPPYGQTDFLVQCDGLGKSRPTIALHLDEKTHQVAIPDVELTDTVPALWISSARRGRASIEATLRSARPDLSLKHVSLKEVPSHFAAMRFAPFILVSLGDFLRLNKAQVDAITGAVRSGVILVVEVADGAGGGNALGPLIHVELGPTGPPSAALSHHLRRVFVQRRIQSSPPSRVRIQTRDAPVLVSEGLGLGEVRVLGVRFQDLEPGKVTETLLEKRESGLSGLFNGLRRMPTLGATQYSPFDTVVWFFLLLLPLGLFLARRRPAYAGLFVLAWASVGVSMNAREQSALFEEAGVFALGAGEKILLAGSMTLTAQRHGDLLLPAGTDPVALERIYGRGGCLVSGETGSAWLLSGEPGARVRASFLAISDPTPAVLESYDQFEVNGAGQLRHAEVFRFTAAPSLPFQHPPDALDAAFLQPVAQRKSKPPLVLALPSVPPQTKSP